MILFFVVCGGFALVIGVAVAWLLVLLREFNALFEAGE
jgi:nitrogenase subunit NifH